MTQYIIDFKNSTSADEIASYLTGNGCTVVKQFTRMQQIYLVNSVDVPPLSEIVEYVIDDDVAPCKLLTLVPVVPAQSTSNSMIDVTSQQDWWKAYSMQDIDLAQQTSVTTVPKFGKDCDIYLLDSGIEMTHTEFVNKNISLLYSVTNDFTDTTGHGTCLASLMIGEKCGLTDAALKVVKIFDKNYSTRQSDLLSAIDCVLHHVIASTNNISVVNLSWSIPKNEYIEQKLLLLISAGAVVVTASGNSGVPIEEVTPASMPDVLTIGSYDMEFMPSNFSDYTGPTLTSLSQNLVNTGALDSWAPGEQIWAAKVGGGFGYYSGTSASSAIYAASLAYNIHRTMDTATRNLISTQRNSAGVVVMNYSKFDRSGLLNLSDPKYITSQNKICTYRNKQDPIANTQYTTEYKMITKVGAVSTKMLFNTDITTAFEVISPLPAGCTIERNFLIFKPIVEPTSAVGVDVSDFYYNVHDVSGAVLNGYIKIVTLSTTFDPAVLPSDDPLIEITELTTRCGQASISPCGGRPGCSSSQYCAGTPKTNCYCANN